MREIKITSPATIFDLAEMAEQYRATRFQWTIIRELTSSGPSYSLRVGEQLIGLAGFVSMEDRVAEAWFQFRPGASRQALRIVRAIRLTMDASPYLAIVTLCQSDAGKRIARAAGFAFKAESDLGEVWAYGPIGRRTGEEGPGGAAAHQPGAIRPATGRA